MPRRSLLSALPLLKAGFVAAARQSVGVVVITSLVILLASHGLNFQETPTVDDNPEAFWRSISPFLVWAYLLIGTGVALSSGRSVDITAVRIRSACHLVRFVTPQRALKTLIVQLSLSAIVFAVIALRTPEFVIEFGQLLGCEAAAAIIWAGTMSIGVACFGANACAALKAFAEFHT